MAAERRDFPRKGVCFKIIYFILNDLINCQLFITPPPPPQFKCKLQWMEQVFLLRIFYFIMVQDNAI